MVQPVSPLLPPPSRLQQKALAITAEYLQRAGQQAATRLLPGQTVIDEELTTLLEFRDRLTQAASLCQALSEVFDGWTFPTGP